MLNFFRKKPLLNYIFPPYQPIDSNAFSADVQSDTSSNEHGLAGPIRLHAYTDKDIPQKNKSLSMSKAIKKQAH